MAALFAYLDGIGNTTRYFRDSLGRVTTMIDPPDRSTQYSYDAGGNPPHSPPPTGWSPATAGPAHGPDPGRHAHLTSRCPDWFHRASGRRPPSITQVKALSLYREARALE